MKSPLLPKTYLAIFLLIGFISWQPASLRSSRHPLLPTVCPPSVQALINHTPSGGTILLPACTFTESLVINNKNLTIIGDVSGNTMIQATTGNRVIEFTGNYTLNLQNLVLVDGNPGNNAGGGVNVPDGSLQMANCILRNNSAAYGGGISQGNNAGSVNITNSLIENNYASYQGGGIFAKGTVTLTDTVFNSNTAGSHGGGLSNWEGDTTIIRGRFFDNHANGGNGGAVNANDGLDVQGTSFEANSASDSGGAITQWNAGFQIVISNATFHANTAKNKGGGIFVNSLLTLDHDVFDANVVDSGSTGDVYGGGVYAGNSGNVTAVPALVVQDSTFTGNKTLCTGCLYSSGGGVYFGKSTGAYPLPTITISRSTFDANQSWFGGGVIADYSTLIVDHSAFTNNSGGYGGGVDAYRMQGEALVFKGNHVVNGGGGVSGYDVTIEQAQFLDNSAGSPGGSSIRAGYHTNLTNILVVQNMSNAAGAIRLESNASGVIHNVTVALPKRGGIAIFFEANTNFEVSNSIFVSHDKAMDVWGNLDYHHNLFYNNTVNVFPEAGSSVINSGPNLQQYPLFVDAVGGDYHLQASSPAIAGGVYTAGVDVDLDYRPRIVGHSAMGAYNYWSTIYLPLIRK